jgi:type VI secretion system protein ImpK
MPIGPDLKSLRQMVVDELDAFGKRAQGIGFDTKTLQLAHYILCAFMDDAVMSTPWGANSVWSQHSLLSAYHNDTQGGDRLFQFAERMEQDPSREPRLMELLYQCLSLGFEGRAALDPRGGALLQQRRSKLAAAIAARQGLTGGDLSPQWQGVEATGGPYQPRVPLWAIITGLGVVALVIFSALLFRLSSRTDAAVAALSQAVGNSQIVPPLPAPETATPTFEQMTAILAPDIGAGRVIVAREGNDIVLRLANQGLFGPAQASPSSSWDPTFGRLAQATNLTSGPLRVEGHTDNQPLRLSLQYPSNLELSVARAQSVASAVTAAGLVNPSRTVVAGRGDAQPLADNATADGRRQNRRVEIRVANDVNWR